MPLDKVWELTLKQRWGSGGEPILGRYYYTSVDAGATAEDLGQGFVAVNGMLDRINGIQTPQIKNDSIRVINLGSLTDFFEDAVAGAGVAGSGDSLPIFNCINFTLKLNTRAVGNGSKRIAGIPEEASTQGVITDAGYIEEVELLRIEMGEIVPFDAKSFNPVVVKRVLRPADVDHENPYYTLPTDDSELVFGNITSVLWNSKVSHQTSRGNGR